jgi:chloramphenicol 3-O-phosphotransferase
MVLMKLVFIYGLPATGKLTIARELATITGYKLFHNHLAVDLILSVFDFGTPPFIQLREEIWLSVFDQACRTQLPGLIFTFAPEQTVRPNFVQEALRVVGAKQGEIDFIELVCPLPELKRRIDSSSRLQFQKLTSVSLFERLHTSGHFDAAHMPKPRLSIDTSLCTPLQAAIQIAQTIKN